MEWLNELFLPDEARQAYKEAKELIDLKCFDLAILKLQLALTVKNNSDFHALKGYCYYKKGMYSSALLSLADALNINKEHKESYYYLGIVHSALKNYSQAIENFRESIKLGFQEAFVFNDLGLTYFKNKENEKALTQYKTALSKNQMFFAAYKNIGDVFFQDKKYKEAISSYKEALIKKTDYDEAYLSLGKAYFFSEEYQKAIDSFKNAIKINKKLTEGYFYLGKAYKTINEYDEAIYYFSFIEESLQTNAPFYNPDYLLELAETYFLAGYIDNSIAIFSKILKISIENYDACLGLGKCYLSDTELKDINLAIYFFEKANKIKPSEVFPYYFLGLAHYSEHKAETGIEYLEKVLTFKEVHNLSLEMLKNLGEIYLNVKQPGRAIKFFKFALKKADIEKTKREKINEIKNLLEKSYDLRELTYKSYIPVESELTNHILILIERIYQKFSGQKLFMDLASKVNDLKGYLDSPLIITVLGEFKVGKSTFINALLGKDIAPMGVTPTTATINYFQYGSRNKIRINWNDGGEADTVRIDKLADYVDERKANQQDIEKIKLVEIFYDWDLLRDINVVDTPGLNAGIKRHEETTINFIEKADAIIWLFDIEQAGKASEKKIFELLKSFSTKSVGVINGLDKVSQDEYFEVKDYLKTEFADNFSDLIGVSAKNALKGKLDNDSEVLAKSNFSELETFLSDKIYKNSKKLKEESIKSKLKHIVLEAQIITDNYLVEYEAIQELLNISETALKNSKQNWSEQLIPSQIAKLDDLWAKMLEQIAKETIELVNPTKGIIESVFGKNKFTLADKDYLSGFIRNSSQEILNSLQKKLEKDLEEQNNSILELFQKILLNTEKKFPEIKSYSIILKINFENKVKEIFSLIIFANIKYLHGYLDAGGINVFFAEVCSSTDLSLNNLINLLKKIFPNIIPSISESLKHWIFDYFTFVENILEAIKKNITDTNDDFYQEFLRPIKKFKEELM